MTPIDFEELVAMAEPRLRRALAGHLPPDSVPDAVSEALTYAWQHRERVLAMDQPIGYLYRVAQSHSRHRKQGFLAWPGDTEVPDVEPALIPALADLPAMQARAVWLVHGCGWTHAEAGQALGVAASTVSTHVARAMTALRSRLGVSTDG